MADIIEKKDPTDLPNELLCHVLSFLSLSDKLRLEAFNHKFQQCVITELKAKPQPLDVHLSRWNGRMNRYPMPRGQVLGALETLAKKAKFSSIRIRIGLTMPDHVERMESILSLLTSKNQCLTKVTSFKINCGCSQAVMKDFLDKCDKLSTIRFEFNVCPLNSGYPDFPLDLAQLLKNKGLTELELRPFHYGQENLTAMFKAIKPNSLRRVDFRIGKSKQFNLVELVKTLHRYVSSSLEQLYLNFAVPVQLADLFESVTRLSSLHRCDIECSFGRSDQFLPALISLFTTSHINITVKAESQTLFTHISGCQMANVIRQIQQVHPGLVVDFTDARGNQFILSLGTVSFKKTLVNKIEHCDADNCIQCQSVYPILVSLLQSRARQIEAQNLVGAQNFPNWQLDRCRIGRIVADLNSYLSTSFLWRALSVEVTEDQQAVTINFVTQMLAVEREFSITISCGQCLSDGCIECV